MRGQVGQNTVDHSFVFFCVLLLTYLCFNILVSHWTRTVVSRMRVLEFYVVVRARILSNAALKLQVASPDNLKKRLTFTDWHVIGPFVQHTNPGVNPAYHLIPAMSSMDKVYHSEMKTPSIRKTPKDRKRQYIMLILHFVFSLLHHSNNCTTLILTYHI